MLILELKKDVIFPAASTYHVAFYHVVFYVAFRATLPASASRWQGAGKMQIGIFLFELSYFQFSLACILDPQDPIILRYDMWLPYTENTEPG